MQKMRQALQRTMAELPESAKAKPEIRAIADMARHRSYNIVHLIYQSKIYEGQSKDYEFGLSAMRAIGRAGWEDIRRTLADPSASTRPLPSSALSPTTFIVATELRRFISEASKGVPMKGKVAIVTGSTSASAGDRQGTGNARRRPGVERFWRRRRDRGDAQQNRARPRRACHL